MELKDIAQWIVGQYGFLGIAMIVMAGVIVYLFKDAKKERAQMRKEHLEEREKWRNGQEKQFETLVKVTQDNTNALRGIEALVQSIDRRTE